MQKTVHIPVKNTTDLQPAPEDRSAILILTAVVLCFLLSGFAALLYQTAWMRQFSIVFGTSEIAVATVLAAYMGGLALGAAVTGRFIHKITRPVLAYGILEAGIALTALSVPWLLLAASTIYVYFIGGQAVPPDGTGTGQSLFYLVVAFIVLALPTGFMGATLPLLTRHAVRTDRQLGPRVALLYAVNTFGAVLGAVIAGFILLPKLGLNGTVWVGVAVNGLVFLIAWKLAKHLQPLPVIAREGEDKPVSGFIRSCLLPLMRTSGPGGYRGVFESQSAWILPIMTFSGLNAFMYEVLWTRLLNHVLGGSIYAFATMLASFLSGIAIGGALAGRFASDRGQAASFFILCQLAIAILSILVFTWIEQFVPGTRGLVENALFAAVVMLPSTIFIGATFPLAVRVLSRDESQAGPATANVYAWNTIGAIGGAILAGFYIIPLLGFEGTIRLAVLINITLALLSGLLISARRAVYAGISAVCFLLALLAYHPHRPRTIIWSSPIDVNLYENSKELFFAVGRSSTVFLMDNGGSYSLRTNGLPEASMFAKGSPPVRHSQKWLTALPVIARPDAESMLVVGFGGGMALEGVPESIRSVDVIELEPEVISANRVIGDVRYFNPLEDPRVNIIINDARNALKLTDRKYDVIVSQPSHPWTAGASHLFTREFISIAREHLSETGIYLQWMNSQFTNEALLKSLAATMLAEFEFVRVYQPDPTVLFFLGARTPIQIELQMAATGRPLRDDLFHYSKIGINSVEDVLLTLAMDEEGLKEFARFASPSTDNYNQMATRSDSFAKGLSAKELIDLFAPYDPLLDPQGWVYTSLPDIDLPYIASRLIQMRMESRANKMAAVIPDRSTQLLINAMGLSFAGKRDDSRQYMRAAIAEDPANIAARYFYISSTLAQLALGTADDETRMIANSLHGPAAAVVNGWKFAAEKNWQELARLDPELRQSEPTDVWYGDAAQLRAEWRTKVLVEGENRYAYDALRILDRALMISPLLDLYVLRTASAILLDDPDATVESARYVGVRIEDTINRTKSGDYTMSNSVMELMQGRLHALITQMDVPLLSQTHGRNLEVRDYLQKLLAELKSLDTGN